MMQPTSYFGKRYKGSLDSILNDGDFAANSLQQVEVNQKGYTPDGFKAGKSTFYNGASGDVQYKQMQFLGGHSYGKEKRLVKRLARELGWGWWIFGFSADYGHYEGEKFVKGKPKVEGTKSTYVIKDLSAALSLCTGGRKGEVEIIFDKAANTVDVKYMIKPEKRMRKGTEVVLPVHQDVVRGYLNKIYKGFAYGGGLQFTEVVNAQRQAQQPAQAPAPQPAPEDAPAPGPAPQHGPQPAGG